MLSHNPGQLEHRHLRLAEHRQQLGVGVDRTLASRFLQVLFIDVVTRLLDVFRTGHLLSVDQSSGRVTGFNWTLTLIAHAQEQSCRVGAVETAKV